MWFGWSFVLAVGVGSLVSTAPIQRVIASPQVHVFELPLQSRQFFDGVVDQGETDLTVTVLAPNGRRLATFDGRERGPELVSFVAPESGTYRMEIRTVASNVRRAVYRAQFEPPREPTPLDERRFEAEQLATNAKQLFGKGDASSLRQSLELQERARSLWEEAGERPAELAALASTADTLYSLAEYQEADLRYREARSLARDLGDVRTEAEILNNLAMTSWSLGNIFDGPQLLDEALGDWRTLQLPYGEAIALSNRGILLWESGDYDEARRYYGRALTLFRRLNDSRGQAYALNNIGVVLEALGERQEALAYLGRAVVLFRQVHDSPAEGKAVVRQSRIQLALGDRKSSLVSAEHGLAVVKRSGDRLAEADALTQLGRSFAANGAVDRALINYTSALDVYRSIGSRRGEADALHAIGLAAFAAGDREKAAENFRQAFEVRHSAGLRGPEAETLYRLAQTERARGELESARSMLEKALEIVDTLRSGILEREQRASFSSSTRGYLDAYVGLLLEFHRRQPSAGFDRLAFEAAERSRARGLTELLRETRTGASAGQDTVLLARDRQLRKELNYWSWLLWQQSDRADAARLKLAQTRIERLEDERNEAEGDARRADPRLAALLRPDFLPLTTLQHDVLDKDTVLLEYWLGEERSHLWAITRDAVSVVELPRQAEIERRARRYYDLVSTRRDDEGSVEGARVLAGESGTLGRLLLSPVAATLNRRRVVVVADGALHYVPFAALFDPRDGAPLAARHEIVSVASATTLALLQREDSNRRPAPKTLAVFADPVFDRSDPRVKSPAADQPSTSAVTRRRFTRLPFSRDEAEQIASLVPSSLTLKALDFEASRTVVTKSDIGQYQFVHFATHAVQNDRYPELSGIVLSLVDAAGREQDGFLRLHDLYDLRLHASLVVLSACETGLGKQVSGEGLIGFAQGLFYAGAARVVSTLWKVDDEATATLMRLFYRNLLGGARSSPAEALRAAQAAMMAQERWKEPYYWSGFVIQGEW